MSNNHADRNDEEGSQWSVSSGEQTANDYSSDYLTESNSFEHDMDIEDVYNAIVHELETGVSYEDDDTQEIECFEDEESLEFIAMEDSVSDLHSESSNPMKEAIGNAKDAKAWKKNPISKDAPSYFRQRSSEKRRQLLILFLTIVFMATVWTVTNAFMEQHKSHPTSPPLLLDEKEHKSYADSPPPLDPSDNERDSSSQLGYVSTNVERKKHHAKPIFSSINVGGSDPVKTHVLMEKETVLESRMEFLSSTEYQSANVRTRSAASMSEVLP